MPFSKQRPPLVKALDIWRRFPFSATLSKWYFFDWLYALTMPVWERGIFTIFFIKTCIINSNIPASHPITLRGFYYGLITNILMIYYYSLKNYWKCIEKCKSRFKIEKAFFIVTFPFVANFMKVLVSGTRLRNYTAKRFTTHWQLSIYVSSLISTL